MFAARYLANLQLCASVGVSESVSRHGKKVEMETDRVENRDRGRDRDGDGD